MSIKSQKSLNDECSEIFEKSYSIKSASEESLSLSEDEDEDACLARQLLLKLSPPLLSRLRRCFRNNRERTHAQDLDRRVEEVMRVAAAEEGIEFAASAPAPEDSMWLDENTFVAALDNIFGHRKYSVHAHKLFRALDAFGSGRVWWRQLLMRLVAAGARQTRSRADLWRPLTEMTLKRLDHCKRETIVKIECVETPDSFCYVAVSKGGHVGVYGGDLNLLHSYEIFTGSSGVRRRVKNRWVTDAVYLSDVQCVVLSSSDRCLTIYEASTVAHTLLYCISGLPNIPTCLAYSPSCSASDASELAFGTECGDVTRLRFLQPRVQLLHIANTDAPNYYFWMELSSPPHTSYCVTSSRRGAHARVVRRVRYSRRGALLVSCAHDTRAALRAVHSDHKFEDILFKLQPGISCFHMVSALQLVATGSADGAVRLWGCTATAPHATLRHDARAPVVDVAILPQHHAVVAYCSNCMLHIWDLYEECLLQSIKIQFPFLGVLGRKVEFGTYSIHPGPARKEPEEELSEPVELCSRRGSSVYQGSTGGLMLQQEDDNDGNRRLEEESECAWFSRSEVLLSCGAHVCVVRLCAARGALRPPPHAHRRARRPSAWDLPDYPHIESQLESVSPEHRALPQLLSPSAAYTITAQTDNLDTLLENAGLKGILEKDFVLMQGLKNDLNRKLAEIEANKETVSQGVMCCAPHVSLKLHPAPALTPPHELAEQYRRVMRLFPGGSVAGTPSGSQHSTPRHSQRSRP